MSTASSVSCWLARGWWRGSGHSARRISNTPVGSAVMRIVVFGAAGRMGAEVCRAVAADPDLELVGAVDPHHAGIDVLSVTGADVPGVSVEATAAALDRTQAEVAVDFTELAAARANLAWCAKNGVH